MGGNFNRVVAVYHNWEKEEENLRSLSGLQLDDKDLLKAKYDFLVKGMYRVGVNPGVGEKLALAMMKGVLENLEKQIYPNRFLRAVRQMKVAMIDRPGYIDQFLKFKQENLRQLDAVLKSKGLGHYFGKLEQYLDFERPQVDVDLSATLNGNVGVDFRVHLEKNASGAYEMEGLGIKIRYADAQEKNRYFDFSSDYQIGADKAVNLLMGRAVVNGKSESNQWIQLEDAADPNNYGIKVFQTDYGFNLSRVLDEFAGETGIYRVTATDVIQQLNEGHQVRLAGRHPSDEPVFIEARPGTKGILIRDLKQNVIGVEEVFMGTKQAQEKENGRAREQGNQLLISQTKSQTNHQDQSLGLGS